MPDHYRGSVPDTDIHVDEGIVRGLIADQCPDLASLALRHVADGFDNSLWRVGEELVVRLPRRRTAVDLMRNELRWLPELAPSLPLPTSTPLRVGRPIASYPYPWSLTRWFDGRPAYEVPLVNPGQTAEALARFMHALHRPAPRDAPGNEHRGVPLSDRADLFESRIRSVESVVDADPLRRIWDLALASRPWEGPPLWIHGDLHPMNLVVERGRLNAVIDFGDLCAGDPATDVACAWMLLPRAATETFLVS